MEHKEYLQQYIQDAKRTESTPTDVKFNIKLLQSYLTLLIEASNILDLVKKGLFYNNYDKYKANILDKLKRIATTTDELLTLDFNTIAVPDNEYLDEYLNMQNGAVPCKINTRLFHGMLGSVTESGELAQIIFDSIASGKVDVPNTIEEVSDFFWYFAIIHDSLDRKIEHTFDINIAKLKARFPEKYTDENANNRNLVEERKILES